MALCVVLCSVYGADWSCKAPIKLVHASYAKSKQQQDEEVVVLSKVLSADINLGYQDIGELRVLVVGFLVVLTQIGFRFGYSVAVLCWVCCTVRHCSYQHIPSVLVKLP